MRPDRWIAPEASGVPVTRSSGLLILACLSTFAALGLAVGITHRDRPVYGHAEERINPNSAPIGSLIRLPGIGPSRAHAIAAYRRRKNPAQIIFTGPDDIQQIRGIGPATVTGMTPWLTFQPHENTADPDADDSAGTPVP